MVKKDIKTLIFVFLIALSFLLISPASTVAEDIGPGKVMFYWKGGISHGNVINAKWDWVNSLNTFPEWSGIPADIQADFDEANPSSTSRGCAAMNTPTCQCTPDTGLNFNPGYASVKGGC